MSKTLTTILEEIERRAERAQVHSAVWADSANGEEEIEKLAADNKRLVAALRKAVQDRNGYAITNHVEQGFSDEITKAVLDADDKELEQILSGGGA
jgi:cytochrome c556